MGRQNTTLGIQVEAKDAGATQTLEQVNAQIAQLQQQQIELLTVTREMAKAGQTGTEEYRNLVGQLQAVVKEKAGLNDIAKDLKEIADAPAADELRAAAEAAEALAKTAPQVEQVATAVEEVGKAADDVGKDKVPAIVKGLDDAGKAGPKAGADIAGGMDIAKTALLGVAAVIGIVVSAFTAIAGLLTRGLDLRAKLADDIDALQDLTGVSTEFGSAILLAFERAGVSSDTAIQAVSQMQKALGDAQIQLRKQAEDEAAANAIASEKRTQLAADTATRIAEIRADEADKIGNLVEAQTERDAAFNKARADAATEGAAKIKEIETALASQLDDLSEQHATRQAEITQRITRQQDDAARNQAERQRGYDEQQAEQKETLNEKLAALDESRASTIDDLNKRIAALDTENAAERISNEEDYTARASGLARDLARTREDFAREGVERDANLAADLIDNAERLNSRLTDITERRADRQRAAEESIEDLQLAFADRQQARQERLAEQQERLDERTNSQREALESRLINARDTFEQTALQAELDALNTRTEKEKAALTDKAQAESDKAQTELDLKLAKIQERVDREQAAFNAQTAQITADAAKRAAELTAIEAQQTADAIRNNERRVADLQERIATEATAHAEQLAAFNTQTESIRASYLEQVAALRERITQENAETDAQKAKLLADYDERAAKQAETLQRQTTEAQRQNAQQLADLTARQAAETASFNESTADAIARAQERGAKLQEVYAADDALAIARFTKQSADNAKAQADILAATETRIAKVQEAGVKSLAAVDAQLAEFMRNSAQNISPVVELLNKMGISAEEFFKKSPAEQFDILARNVGLMADGTSKAHAAQVLFGESGRKLIDGLELFSTRSKESWQLEAQNLNKAIGTEGVEAMEAFREKNVQLQERLDGFLIRLAGGVIPALNIFLDKLIDYADNHADEINAGIDTMGTHINSVLTAVTGLVTYLNGPEAAAAFGTISAILGFNPGAVGSAAANDVRQAVGLPGTTPLQGDPALELLQTLIDIRNNGFPIGGGTPIVVNYNGTPAPPPGQVVQSLAVLGGP